MKLAFAQLAVQVTKKLASIYVVSGDEPLLIQEAVDIIREAALQAGFAERVRIPVESATEWGKALLANSQSLSLFSSQRILELDLSTVKLNAASSKILQEYAQNIPQDTLLLVRTNKLDSKSEQSSWYKALDKVGMMVPIWPIPLEQLPNWILQRSKKISLTMSSAAAEFLAAQVEGNLLAAAQELEKLRLLQTTDIIDQKTIENAITDSAHFDIFTLVDSALLGNAKRSLRILDNLFAEDMEPTLVLWALTREIRTMAEIAKQVQQGVGLGSLFPKFRIWEKRQGNVRAFIQRHKQEKCWELLTHAAQIDRMIKGADSGNIWDSLKQLVLKMG